MPGMLKSVPTPVAKIEAKPSHSSTSIVAGEDIPLPKRYYDYFGTKWEMLEFDRDGQKELNFIWDMAKEKVKNQDVSSILVYVNRLANKLGSPEVGQTRYNKIYNYLLVNKNINSLLSEKRAYERKRE